MLGPSLRRTEQDVCEAPFSSPAPREPTPGIFLSMTNSGTRDLRIGFEERRPWPCMAPPHFGLVQGVQSAVGLAESQKIDSAAASLARAASRTAGTRQAGSPTV